MNFSETAALYYGMLYIVGGILVLILSKYVADLLMPYKINRELVQADNHALGVTLAGYYTGVVIIYLGAVVGGSGSGHRWRCPGRGWLRPVLCRTGHSGAQLLPQGGGHGNSL